MPGNMPSEFPFRVGVGADREDNGYTDGEHSNLSVNAGETLKTESLDILQKLHQKVNDPE